MVVTTQWPLKRAAHLTSLVWVCVLWLPWKLNGAICAMGSNWQQPGTSLDNGLALNRRQAIIWTNADPFHWRIYAALGGWWVKVGWGWWFKLIKQPCRHCQMNFFTNKHTLAVHGPAIPRYPFANGDAIVQLAVMIWIIMMCQRALNPSITMFLFIVSDDLSGIFHSKLDMPLHRGDRVCVDRDHKMAS